VSTAVQAAPDLRRDTAPARAARIVADGKFLRTGDERFLVKGVTYGTFAPDAEGYQFPPAQQIARDFRLMAEFGINTVRVYTPPRRELLDEAARLGLRVMVGLPWSQHVAFLDDRRLKRAIRRELAGKVAEIADHPAVLMLALGNEIPAPVVRWHGRVRVERFLREIYQDAKDAAPGALFTYVNFPPTEFLDLSFFDVCAFNLYLHREPELRAYIARLQHIAGQKPLLLAEAGADELVVADTVGYADPTQVRAVFKAVMAEIGTLPIAAHFHDTRGTGLANVGAALDCGVRSFDASLAGLGGCPFAPGATGNIVMDDLCFMLDSMGLRTGVDLEKLLQVRRIVREALPDIEMQGALARAGLPRNYLRAEQRRAA